MQKYYLIFISLLLMSLGSISTCLAQEKKQGHQDGKIRYKGVFKDGKPIGELIRYYQDGKIQAKMNHKGDTVDAVLYSKDGEYTSSGQYVDKKRDGGWQYKKGERLLISEIYRNNLLCGKSILYGNDERVVEEKFWKSGKLNGAWHLYYDNGQLRMQTSYVDGVLNGELTSYTLTGQLITKGYYKDNLKEGKWLHYDDAGKLLKKQIYHAGISENAEEEELEESKRLDALINSSKKILDPAAFVDDPDAYIQLIKGEIEENK